MTVRQPGQSFDDVSIVGELAKLAAAAPDDEDVIPQAVAALKCDRAAVGRPARIEVVAGNGTGDDAHLAAGWRGGDQLDVAGGQPEKRQASVPADVRAADAVDDPSRRAAQRGDAPDFAFHLLRPARREIDERVAVRRPSRKLMVDVVTGDLHRHAAGDQADEDLAPAVHAGGEYDRSSVRRNCRKLLDPRQVGQALDAGNLDGDHRSA